MNVIRQQYSRDQNELMNIICQQYKRDKNEPMNIIRQQYRRDKNEPMNIVCQQYRRDKNEPMNVMCQQYRWDQMAALLKCQDVSYYQTLVQSILSSCISDLVKLYQGTYIFIKEVSFVFFLLWSEVENGFNCKRKQRKQSIIYTTKYTKSL